MQHVWTAAEGRLVPAGVGKRVGLGRWIKDPCLRPATVQRFPGGKREGQVRPGPGTRHRARFGLVRELLETWHRAGFGSVRVMKGDIFTELKSHCTSRDILSCGSFIHIRSIKSILTEKHRADPVPGLGPSSLARRCTEESSRWLR